MSYEEILQDTGRYRVKLVQEDDAEEPYDEGASPLLRAEGRYGCFIPDHVIEHYMGPECARRIEMAALRWGVNDPKFGKYLRAYHGVTRIEQWSSRDCTYVTYDDAAWRENTGAPEGSISLDEYRAWCEGDVWGYVIEKNVQWKRVEPTGTDADLMETWEQVESCWGFYGYDYAREAVAGEFAVFMELAESKSMNEHGMEAVAQLIAQDMTAQARTSDEPVVFVTGNAYVPPLRSYPAAEMVWQSDENQDGELFAALEETVEDILGKNEVYLGSPEYDNCLYVVDLRRFEYFNEDSETLSGEWRPVPPFSPVTKTGK